MRKKVIRVSAIQLPAEVKGKSFVVKQRNNLQQIRHMMSVAGKRGSDIVLLGEYANLHHRTWSTRKSEYVPDRVPGLFTKAIAAEARRFGMNVVVPMFGRYENKLSSVAVVIDRKGTIVAGVSKTHPHEAEQAMGIVPGNDLQVIALDCANIGLMTCMDIEYPEVAQILMLKGAEILLFPHVQASWGEVDWEIRYRARAIDTGLYVVSACYGYPEGEWQPGKMIGRSGVVGRDGLILADIGRSIGVLTFDMDLNQKRITHFFFTEKFDRTTAVMASRRPEMYGELTTLSSKHNALRRLKRTAK